MLSRKEGVVVYTGMKCSTSTQLARVTSTEASAAPVTVARPPRTVASTRLYSPRKHLLRDARSAAPALLALLTVIAEREVVHAGEQLGDDAPLHLSLGGLSLGGDGVNLVDEDEGGSLRREQVRAGLVGVSGGQS